MASFQQHRADCVRWLGSGFDDVHRWLDEYFAQYGPLHRKFRHHQEGIREARRIFGEMGGTAAMVHILRDCRNIPRSSDYTDGTVDALGLKKGWPIEAYSQYTEEAFSTLVRYNIQGPTGVLLWSFIGSDLGAVLGSVTKLSPEAINELTDQWKQAVEHRQALEPVPPAEIVASRRSGPVEGYFAKLKGQPLFAMIQSQFVTHDFAYVSVEHLITPLLMVDFEYVEELRAEFRGEDDLSVARFALPEETAISVKGGTNLTERSATFVSPHKTLALGAISVQQVAGGAEVKYVVANAATPVIVSRINGRIYLRSGIHRAFLLASMGKKEIPCMLVAEREPPILTAGYPSFSPTVLTLPRPPLLVDYLDESLSLTVPIQRTHKVIRIRAEEFVVPVD